LNEIAPPRQLKRWALVAVDEMTLFGFLLGDRQETALLLLVVLFLFVLSRS
jgi:hypothetical protein